MPNRTSKSDDGDGILCPKTGLAQAWHNKLCALHASAHIATIICFSLIKIIFPLGLPVWVKSLNVNDRRTQSPAREKKKTLLTYVTLFKNKF